MREINSAVVLWQQRAGHFSKCTRSCYHYFVMDLLTVNMLHFWSHKNLQLRTSNMLHKTWFPPPPQKKSHSCTDKKRLASTKATTSTLILWSATHNRITVYRWCQQLHLNLFLWQFLVTTHYSTLYYLQNNTQVKSLMSTMVKSGISHNGTIHRDRSWSTWTWFIHHLMYKKTWKHTYKHKDRQTVEYV